MTGDHASTVRRYLARMRCYKENVRGSWLGYMWIAGSTLAAVVTLLVLEIVWHIQGRWSTGFEYSRGLLLSVFATAIVGVMLAIQEVRPVVSRLMSLHDVLGLRVAEDSRTARSERRTLLVLPTFLAHDEREPPGLPIGTIKWRGDTDERCFVRHDVILATEIAELLSQHGLPPPLIKGDREVVQELLAGRDNSPAEGIFIASEGEKVRVQDVIVVGLFSNAVTWAIAYGHGWEKLAEQPAPLELQINPHAVVGTDDDRLAADNRSLVVRYEDNLDERSSWLKETFPFTKWRSDHDDAMQEFEPALVMRLQLADVNAVILGGVSATGTARLGDFFKRDGGFERLRWHPSAPGRNSGPLVKKASSYWFVLKCPGHHLRHREADIERAGGLHPRADVRLSQLITLASEASVESADHELAS